MITECLLIFFWVSISRRQSHNWLELLFALVMQSPIQIVNCLLPLFEADRKVLEVYFQSFLLFCPSWYCQQNAVLERTPIYIELEVKQSL